MSIRHFLGVTLIALAAIACGGGALSLPEYADELNDVVVDGRDRIEPLYVEFESAGEPTVESLRSYLQQEAAIRADLQEEFASMEAPDQVADLHAALVNWHGQVLEAQAALLEGASATSSLEEFQQSEEYLAFEVVMNEGLEGCRQLQEMLDATEARGVFADVPWIPGQLKEVVDAALGCGVPPGE